MRNGHKERVDCISDIESPGGGVVQRGTNGIVNVSLD